MFTAAGDEFSSWYQHYGWNAGSDNSDVQRYAVGGTTLIKTDDSAIGSPGMVRDPLDSLIFLDKSEGKLFAKTKVFDASEFRSVYYDFDEVIYAIDMTNKRVASKTMFFEYPIEVYRKKMWHQFHS